MFTDLLTKGKRLPVAEETDTSVIFKIDASKGSGKLIDLSRKYQEITRRRPTLEQLLILNELVNKRSCSINQLRSTKFINKGQLNNALQDLIDTEIVEATGRSSGTKYIIHKKHYISVDDRIQYTRLKKQDKARQKESILRYIEDFGSINNSEARSLLSLTSKDVSYVSRLFKSMVSEGLLELIPSLSTADRRYKKPD